MVLSLAVLFALVSSASCGFFDIGPVTTVAQFKGQITEHGRPVPAHVSLEVLYKINGEDIPVSLVQLNSPSEYDFIVHGLVLQNENISREAVLRVQALSVNGGSKAVKLNLEDKKTLYEQDVELGHRHPGPNVLEALLQRLKKKEQQLNLKLGLLEQQHVKLLDRKHNMEHEIRHLSRRIGSLRNELNNVRILIKKLSHQVVPIRPVGVEVRKTTKRSSVPRLGKYYLGQED